MGSVRELEGEGGFPAWHSLKPWKGTLSGAVFSKVSNSQCILHGEAWLLCKIEEWKTVSTTPGTRAWKQQALPV